MDEVMLVAIWVVLLILAVVVVALARQVGALYERIAPAGALMIDKGPAIGEEAPVYEVRDIRQAAVKVGGLRDRSTLLFFMSPTCPVCKTLLPAVKSLFKSERSWLDVYLVTAGDDGLHEGYIRKNRLSDLTYIVSEAVASGFRVGKLPYGVLLDEAGKIASKGLVNSREHLESLLEAKRLGVASIQDYMHAAHAQRGEQSA